MSEFRYNVQFEKLCAALDLGELTAPPAAISGGLLHRMYAVETSTGKYAVKALNPQIMARPTAIPNYLQAEKVVTLAAAVVSAKPAKRVNGTFLQQVAEQYYLVFDWIEGDTLRAPECTETHCRQMGAILAEIHNTDFTAMGKSESSAESPKAIDWNGYLQQGIANQTVWAELMSDTMESLVNWSQKVQEASRVLAGEYVYSHRDLEPKNVMWHQGSPILIDWESAGPIHPRVDLLETAMYWSLNEQGTVDEGKFTAFLAGYNGDKRSERREESIGSEGGNRRNGSVEADWLSVLAFGYLSKLEWLEYSLKRSLGLESTDKEDQAAGTRQVTETIQSLKAYEERVVQLAAWLSK